MTTPSLLGLGDVDRRHVFHPFSVLSEHESSGPRRMIVEGRGSTLTDDQGQLLPRRDGGAVVRQCRLWAAGDRGGAQAPGAEAALLPRVLVDGDRRAGAAGGAADRARARRACRRCSTATPGPTPTTRRSSSCGCTTTCSGGRRRRRSSRAGAGITASRWAPRACPGCRACTRRSTCRCRRSGTSRRRTALWEADAGRVPTQQFSARLAQELEELIIREGPETVAAFIAEPIQAAGGVIVPPGRLLRGDPGPSSTAMTCC